MPSMFGDKFGGFRLPFTRPRAQSTPTTNQPSNFQVLGRQPRAGEAQGFQVLRGGQRPGANTAPATPAGWSLSPTTPLSAHPTTGSSSPRSGSPTENYQHATFGGDAMSPSGSGPLRITNPDPQSPPRTPSPTPAPSDTRPQGSPSNSDNLRSQLTPLQIPGRQAAPQRQAGLDFGHANLSRYPDSLVPGRGTGGQTHLPPELTFQQPQGTAPHQHPDSLTPGRGNPPPTRLTPDLTFEQTPSPVRRHPDNLTPGHGSPSSLPLTSDLTFEQPIRHPDSLTPGRGPAPRHPLTPDLSFETPHSASSSRSSSPDFEFRPGERRSSIVARPGNGPQTFSEMGFVHVQKQTKWYNPSTWGRKETRTMMRDQVDPRRHTILPSPPPLLQGIPPMAAPAGLPSRSPSPEGPVIAQPEPRRPAPRQENTPASSLAEARDALRARGRRVQEPPTFDPKILGNGLQRPSRPGLEDQ